MIDDKDERFRLSGQGGERVHHLLRLARAVLVVEAGGGRQGVDDDDRQSAIEILFEMFGGLLRERLQPLEGFSSVRDGTPLACRAKGWRSVALTPLATIAAWMRISISFSPSAASHKTPPFR